jgi:mannose-6-phosphate isomerase-like protein (cupin superfamily)
MMIEMIQHQGQMIAMIVRKDYHREGIHFFTDQGSLLQLGYISRPKGYEVRPHEHNPVHRHTVGTQEVLFVKSGSMKVDFYDYDKTYLESRELSAGDFVLFAGAGHGITMTEATTLVEVKNGPYIEETDKKRYGGKQE